MGTPLIPMRPKGGKFALKAEEMQGLTYYVLSGCTRDEAFVKFVRPDYIGSKMTPALKSAIMQFFAAKDVKDYVDEYRKTIEELLNPPEEKTPRKAKSLEERKALAKAKATEFAIELADHIDDATDPEFVMKMLDKVGIFDGDNEGEEAVRRYLPVSCGDCLYRKFVEENCEEEEEPSQQQ